VDGRASLKPFVKHLRKLLASNPRPKSYSFHEGDVFVGFDVHRRRDEPMDVVVGLPDQVIFGGQHDVVRSHIDEKLAKYKIPLIVALDFMDCTAPFTTVEDVLLGRRVFHSSIDPSGRGAVGKPQAGRARDSILVRRDADGERARKKLQAVLAFMLMHTDHEALEVHARVFGNPAAEVPLRLREFAPIPRLVVVEQTETQRRLQYLDADENPVEAGNMAAWRHVP